MSPPQGSPRKPRLLLLSGPDPVAQGVASSLGVGEATDWHVEGAPVRRLSPDTLTLRREARHIHDEGLNSALPEELGRQLEAVIFPSVHRSEAGRLSLTVHPLGNLTNEAPVGGRPGRLNPVPARLMTEAFLRLREEGERCDIETTFEATHHGPFLDYPSFFVEVGSSPEEWERPDLHRALARALTGLNGDRVAGNPIVVGVGGGHYVPRFKDLVRRRAVAVSHLVPSHHLPLLDEARAREVVRASPGAGGCFYAKAGERGSSPLADLLPEIREKDLPARA